MVHDSADYYQLKISIFTDDKRTDLVGEAWIDLKGIIVPGGGQSDVWQSLSCKGKYAGEIRLEITYYDSRPKPERPAVKTKQPSSAEQEVGSVRQRTPMKRRPLPSDPVTGEAPSSAPMPAGPIGASTADMYGQQTPPRTHVKHASHSGFIPNQSPLQSVEYNTPPSRSHQNNQYGTSPQAGTTPEYHTPTRSSRLHGEREYSTSHQSPYEEPESRRQYSQNDLQDLHPRGSPRNLPPIDCDQPPPPPPAHRSRHSSVGPEPLARDPSPQKSSMPMRHDVLRSEAHRHTASTSALPNSYQPYQPGPSPTTPHSPMGYDRVSPRHNSYDSVYDPSGRIAQAEELHFESGPSAGAYSRSAGASPSYMSHAHRQGSTHDIDNGSYPASVSPMSAGDYPSSRGPSPQKEHGQRPSYRDVYESNHGRNASSHGIPAPPSSLAHSVDPRLSRDISERIHEERRYDDRYGGHAASGRGRQWSEPPPTYGHGRGPSPQTHQSPSYDRRTSGVTYSGGPEDMNARRSRQIETSPTPNSQHRIPRKSVSPAPLASEHRTLSDMPFGPDSYDALNPSMVSSRSSHSAATPEPRDPNAKIISHDGREIDPSDHLPMESWAPEPEPRPSSRHEVETRSRPSLAGAQPMPQSGRRAGRSSRSESMPAQQSYGYEEPRTPASGGRNRLQKKAGRTSAVSPSASSPLAPISPDNFQDRQSPYTPTRHSARGGAYEYANENHAPAHYGSGPPIPAKVPLPVMSGANGADRLLAEEMQRIDIGTGRSRRRGGY